MLQKMEFTFSTIGKQKENLWHGVGEGDVKGLHWPATSIVDQMGIMLLTNCPLNICVYIHRSLLFSASIHAAAPEKVTVIICCKWTPIVILSTAQGEQ